jgi:hypothetical protein
MRLDEMRVSKLRQVSKRGQRAKARRGEWCGVCAWRSPTQEGILAIASTQDHRRTLMHRAQRRDCMDDCQADFLCKGDEVKSASGQRSVCVPSRAAM